MTYLLLLLIIGIIALLAIVIISINSDFENTFAQNQNKKDLENPQLVIESDKNITIMAMEKPHLNLNKNYLFI